MLDMIRRIIGKKNKYKDLCDINTQKSSKNSTSGSKPTNDLSSVVRIEDNECDKAIRFVIYGFMAPNKYSYPLILDQKTVELIFRYIRSNLFKQMIDNFKQFTQNRPSDVELESFIRDVSRKLSKV